MHKIFVPQLAVADFEVQNVADALRQLESISTKDSGSFSFYYKKDAHTGTFYKLFSRSGGRLVLAEKEYIYRPLERSSTPRIRLVLAVPSDRVHVTTQHE
ncbi:unnamed protein product [Anisakis simplex]|uniref:Outer membrane lipoprotein carrier protein LolA n=1 Tax=Anisakis simplex TaxID=6269 RepID=A0A0M3JB69_ANISI|nr:unnamed protein product [Anisakis simplex]